MSDPYAWSPGQAEREIADLRAQLEAERAAHALTRQEQDNQARVIEEHKAVTRDYLGQIGALGRKHATLTARAEAAEQALAASREEAEAAHTRTYAEAMERQDAVQALAAMTAERDAARDNEREADVQCDAAEHDLAESLAREEAKDAALRAAESYLFNAANRLYDGTIGQATREFAQTNLNLLKAAIAQPRDSSALDAYTSELMHAAWQAGRKAQRNHHTEDFVAIRATVKP